jgi:hypothetical protein
MSVLESLLFMQRRDCEERRRYLAGLELLAERLRVDAGRLRPDDDDRRRKLAGSIGEIEAQIAAAGAALATAEETLRRHERVFSGRADAAPGNPPRAGRVRRRRPGR